MSAFRIVGAGGTSTDVDASSNLYVSLPDGQTARGSPSAIGALRIKSQTSGIDLNSPIVRPETSDDFKMRVGRDHPLDQEIFTYASQHTGKYFYAFTTMTMNQASNTLVTNNGNIVTTATGCVFRTFRWFSLFGSTNTMSVSFTATMSAVPPTDTVLDYGFFTPGAANPFAPTDGVYFRVTSAGICGVVNFGGIEAATEIFDFVPGLEHRHYEIRMTQKSAEFFIDGVFYEEVLSPTFNANLYASWQQPMAIRHAILGNAASHAFSFKLYNYAIITGDLASNRPWSDRMSSWGQSYQGQSGQTMGTVALYANSQVPTSLTALNGSAVAGTVGLGGYVILTNVDAGGGSTDVIVNSYQNPAGTIASPGKTLFIKGAWVSAYTSGTTVATTSTCISWALAYGATSANLGLTESTSFASATVKAPRIVPLGYSSIDATKIAGTPYTPGRIYVPFTVPIPVNQGEFLMLVGKVVAGTATVGQTVTVINGYDYYWE